MLKAVAILLLTALAACATRAPSSPQWTNIEGCWFENSGEIWPAYMSWQRDPDHPGGYVGDWHREEAQGDIDRVRFRLTPVGDQMQLCDRRPGGSERCITAVFGRPGWRLDGVAVLDVQGDYHEFGYAGSTTPFFWGNRRDCS